MEEESEDLHATPAIGSTTSMLGSVIAAGETVVLVSRTIRRPSLVSSAGARVGCPCGAFGCYEEASVSGLARGGKVGRKQPELATYEPACRPRDRHPS